MTSALDKFNKKPLILKINFFDYAFSLNAYTDLLIGLRSCNFLVHYCFTLNTKTYESLR